MADLFPENVARLLERTNALMIAWCQVKDYLVTGRPLPENALAEIKQHTEKIQATAGRLGLKHSERHCVFVLQELGSEKPSMDMLNQHLYALQTSLLVDVEHQCFLFLEPMQAAWYRMDWPQNWGYEGWNRFPNARYDLSEGMKCYALERYTAAVFHSLRPLELSVKAVWRSLYCPGTTGTLKEGWGQYVRQIEDYLEGKKPNLPARPADWAKREAFYQQAHGHIKSVTRAWRNRVMHMERHYEHNDAAAICDACTNLFRFVAQHLTQRGRYKP